MKKVEKSIADVNASKEVTAVVESNNVNPLGEKIVKLNDLGSRIDKLNETAHKMNGSTKKTSKKSDPKAPKVPGVIESIFLAIEKSGEKGISKAQILARLVAKFPDREKEGMEKTINVQLPKRMSKEREVKIEKTEKGNFILVK
jgi:hypothetical protein